MLPFCWFFMRLVKHYRITIVNDRIDLAKRRQNIPAIAQIKRGAAYRLNAAHVIIPKTWSIIGLRAL